MMKKNKTYRWQFAVPIAAIVVLLAGCGGKDNSITSRGVQGLSVQPPAFLAGPGGVLLTNIDGFNAHVEITIPTTADEPMTASGELIGRSGRFLYTPMTGIGVTKHTRKSGKAMSFIWDVNKNLGYALNAALQGYALLSPGAEVTNIQWAAKGPRPDESIDGHPCHRTEATVAANNGVTVHFAVWRADDAQEFPVRIQTLSGARLATVEFSNLRFQVLPADALRPPDEFKKYDNADMMVNELMIRETTTSKKSTAGEFPADEGVPEDNSKWGRRPGQ